MCWGPWNENSPAATFYGFSFPLGQSVALPYFQAQPNLTSTLRNYEQVHKARHKLIWWLQILSTGREKSLSYFPVEMPSTPRLDWSRDALWCCGQNTLKSMGILSTKRKTETWADTIFPFLSVGLLTHSAGFLVFPNCPIEWKSKFPEFPFLICIPQSNLIDPH